MAGRRPRSGINRPVVSHQELKSVTIILREGTVNGDWLKRKIVGLGIGILGLAGWLGYHSLMGDGPSPKQVGRIPKLYLQEAVAI